ncbi:MAG: hypothetical protein LBF84_02445 [Holosporales bacterium]|jgi:hypothetical protein|nr:hypothetical protein [Holosporales bacterium]
MKINICGGSIGEYCCNNEESTAATKTYAGNAKSAIHPHIAANSKKISTNYGLSFDVYFADELPI